MRKLSNFQPSRGSQLKSWGAYRSPVFAVVALAATAICAAAARAEVVSLDGIWQAEVAQDAQGDAMPAAFTRAIPVPGHWPLMKPSAPCGKKEALWCRTTWKAPPAKWRVSPALPARTRYVLIEIDDISPNKLASIEEVEIQNAAWGVQRLFSARSCRFRADYLLEIAQPPVEELV